MRSLACKAWPLSWIETQAHLEQLYLYSAFANSCTLQSDTFLFPLIHSHHVLLSPNKFQLCNEWLGRSIPCMGCPYEVTFKVKLAIIQTRFFHTKKEHIFMCSYMISAVYIYIYVVQYLVCLSYSTHMLNAYIAGNLLKIKNRKNEACL